MDAGQFREAAHAAIEDIINYFRSVPDRRVTPAVEPGYLAPNLPRSAPTAPEAFSEIISDVNKHIVPGLTHWQSPRFMAFFPAMTTFPSLLGELYSAAFNAPAFNWLCSPACTELETIVLDWLAQMLGLPHHFLSSSPQGGGGVLQGSASEAIVVVMVAARERYVRDALSRQGFLPEQADDSSEQVREREDAAADIRGRLVAMGSEQAHSATHKSANILGLRYRTIRAGTATGFRMTGQAVRAQIEELRAQGLEPFYLTTSFGTTATCAVDDIEDIVAVAQAVCPLLWIHVDAAYAGAALILPEIRLLYETTLFDGVDSFDMNMHKWLLVNFDASALFVRNRQHLIAALSISPSYLVNPNGLTGLVTDYRDWQIPLGRRFRALKIWFVLRTYGVEAMQTLLREHLRIGKAFAELCRSERARLAGIEIVAGPVFALTVIRLLEQPKEDSTGLLASEKGGNPADEQNSFGNAASTPKSAGNDLTKRVYELVNERGEFFLTSCVVDGTYAIRVISANEAAAEELVRRCFDCILEAISDVRAAITKA